MSEPKPNRPLPSPVEVRKEEMLVSLHGELALLHRRRKRNRTIAGSLAAGAMVVFMGLAMLDFSTEQNTAGSNDVAEQQISQDQPLAQTRPSYVTTVSNNQNVREKYVVGISKTQFFLETVGDEELLRMLANSGNPSFLGKVNGKLRLFPSSRSLSH